MAAPVVSMVLNQLGTFFREEIQKEVRMVVSAKKEVQKLVLGAKEEIEKLEVTLTAIQAVLYDADKKQVQDQRVKLWLERLTEVVYEIEDILDNWNTKIIQSKIRNQNSPVCSHLDPCFCFNDSVLLRNKLGHEIKSLREKLDHLDREKNTYGLASGMPTEVAQAPPRQTTSSLVNESEVLPALLLSYYDLPSSWKPCFTYCAIFPKDYILEKDELIKLWMAHGFLYSTENKEMEKVGEEYFDGIVARSLFQDVKMDEDGNVRSCKMHDLVHDFVQFLTKNETLIVERNDRIANSSKLRHLNVRNLDDPRATLSSIHNTSLRSLNLKIYGLDGMILQLWTCLRSLDLSNNYGLGKLPDEIGELIHLRYLDLSRTSMKKLPNSLSNLCNLQTLKLNECYALGELPASMENMISLRHLEIYKTDKLRSLPEGIERLASLRSLSKFIVSERRKLGDLKGINLIQGSIEISGLWRVKSANEAKEVHLVSKRGIHALTLNFELPEERGNISEVDKERMEGVLEGLQPHPNLEELKINQYPGSKLPSWMMYLKIRTLELKYLTQCTTLLSLGRLPLLEVLRIEGMISVRRLGLDFLGISDIEEENDDATSSINKEKLVVFPNLIKLHIMDMSELEEWVLPFERSDTLQIMPRLRSLTICRATKLKVLPALGRLESLEELTLISLDSLLKRRGPEFFGISEDDVTKGTSGSSRGGESLPIIVLPKLKTLYFFMMEEWEEWKMMMPSWRQDVSFIMPCLKELTLDTCPKLKVVPRNIFSYQPVKERIVDCPELNQLSGMNQIISRREVGESAGKIELYRQSNVLMLGREEIDVLWDYKDQLPKEIKAEVLFPINEEFYEVEEIFSNVDEKVDSDGKEIFCYEYLKMATNNFQDKLGSGGSGSVFKGILKDGTQVAVKRVLHVTLGEQMLSTLANVKHVHLVTLRGYCIHMMGMVRDFYIVYDLLPNGSLDDWIFSSTGDPTGRYLSWKSRYTIAVDVAEALAYLHHDCCPQILHLDVKPANILLDNNFRGVLSDFGFSRLMENDMGTVFSSIIGTTGYIDPGWKYGISVKCDIYSYGKVLMDIFFGKPDVCLNLEGIDMYKRHSEGGNSEREQRIFHAFMWKTLRQGKIMDLFDKRLVENEGVDEREAICLVYAALSCLQDEHELRPHDMREVIDILNQKIQKGTELSRLLELGSTT